VIQKVKSGHAPTRGPRSKNEQRIADRLALKWLPTSNTATRCPLMGRIRLLTPHRSRLDHFILAKNIAQDKLAVMKTAIYVPNSLKAAGRQVRLAMARPLQELSKTDFVRAWCSVAYLFPGLHPDGFDHPESGWTPVLRRFAAEAWRRADAGELGDDELYACDAQWSGLYDRMMVHLPDETERRLELATSFGHYPDA